MGPSAPRTVWRGWVAVATVLILLASPALYRPASLPFASSDKAPRPATSSAPGYADLADTPSPAATWPPPGHLPAGLWAWPARHAIAVDASRSRLYLLQREPADHPDTPGWRVAAEHPVSLGRNGVDKWVEGDARTPLGVYHITSRLQGRSLDPFYGPGALTLDYPNALDRLEGRTGHGIWLHGSAPDVAPRPARDTDGCVVLHNDALLALLDQVALRATPVLIAPQLHWVPPGEPAARRADFEAELLRWRQTRQHGSPEALATFYAPGLRPPADRGALEFKDLGLIAWPDGRPVVQVTLGEVPRGRVRGVTRRQHWHLEQGQWQIFDERTW